MEALENMIREKGRVYPGQILKVDSFLNHQVDVDLILAMGEDFYHYFKDRQVNKILTLEVSGIAIAFASAQFFKVPMVFAKKLSSLTMTDRVYVSEVYSYTKEMTYQIRVDQHFIQESDRVLIIDDFLANGEALKGLIDLVEQAQATVAGIGIAIEKTFQPGGKTIRDLGYDVYSQAMIAGFEDNQVIFADK